LIFTVPERSAPSSTAAVGTSRYTRSLRVAVAADRPVDGAGTDAVCTDTCGELTARGADGRRSTNAVVIVAIVVTASRSSLLTHR
jgi:hypothetical protein